MTVAHATADEFADHTRYWLRASLHGARKSHALFVCTVRASFMITQLIARWRGSLRRTLLRQLASCVISQVRQLIAVAQVTLAGFRTVINCMGDFKAKLEYPAHVAACSVVINHEGLARSGFQSALATVRSRGGPTLVHCKMGEQRSATCVCALVHSLYGKPISDVVRCLAFLAAV